MTYDSRYILPDEMYEDQIRLLMMSSEEMLDPTIELVSVYQDTSYDFGLHCSIPKYEGATSESQTHSLSTSQSDLYKVVSPDTALVPSITSELLPVYI